MDAWITVVSSVGFPIAVAFYLLVVMNKTLKELTIALNANNIAQVKLAEIIQKLCEKDSSF